MSRDSEGLRIVLPVKAGQYRRLLDLIWLCVWAGVEAVLVASLAGARVLPTRPPLLGALTVTFTAAGVFLWYRWLWYWTGKETFVVRADRLTATRGFLGLGRSRTFPRSQIRRIRGRRLKYFLIYPSWGRMFLGNGDGEVVIELGQESLVYAKGLGLEEACSLADLLTQELRAPSPSRRPTEFRPR